MPSFPINSYPIKGDFPTIRKTTLLLSLCLVSASKCATSVVFRAIHSFPSQRT